jgi:hypothetical protein
MTTTSEPATSPFRFDPEGWLTAANERVARQTDEGLPYLFTHVRESNWMALFPLFEKIEAETGITLIAGCHQETNQTLTPEYVASSANLAPNRVAVMRNAFFGTPMANLSPAGHSDTFPAISDRYIEPTPAGLQTWSLYNGVAAGIVGPRAVTVPWWFRNAEHSDQQLERIYDGLLGAVILANDDATWESYASERLTRLSERCYNLLRNSSTTEIEELRRQVPDLVTQATDYETRAASTYARLSEIRTQLEALQDHNTGTDDLEAKLASELRQLDEHPEIATIEPGGNHGDGLVVFTNPLPLTNIQDESMTTNGGEYRLIFRFGPRSSITVRNLTRRIGTFDHPHVSDGNFCTGDQRNLLDQLLTRAELAAAANFTIDLLKQVNPRDTYTSDWRAWFDVPEGELPE